MEPKQKGRLISLRLTDDELEQVEALAESEERSRSQVVRRAIRRYVDDETGSSNE